MLIRHEARTFRRALPDDSMSRNAAAAGGLAGAVVPVRRE
jgi:hypothetical protein